MERYTKEQKESFLKAIESLKKYRRADLIDEEGNNLLEKLYTDLLPDNHILNQSLQDNTTFLIGRKGTGKSTIFLRMEQELRKKNGYLPCYIDVKTVFESAQTENLPEYLGEIIKNQKFYNEYTIKRNFIRKILSCIIEEIDNKIDSLYKRFLARFKDKDVKENIKNLKLRIENNESLKSVEIPNLQKVQVTERKDLSQASTVSATDALSLNADMATAPHVGMKLGMDDVESQSNTSREEVETVYSRVLLKVLQISDLIEQIQSELKRIQINHLVILLDDFSEIPYAEMRTFVDVVLAPLNNWSNDFIKFKVAAYPGRVYYGKIDIGKIDTVDLDFYNLYSEFDRDKMEERAINFTQRLFERRVRHFCKEDVSAFFETKANFQMADYYRLLFYVSMNVPRVIGYILFSVTRIASFMIR